MKRILMAATVASIIFISCKKDSVPEYNASVKAPLSVEFDNIAGAADLALNTGIYTNAAGENFNVTKLKYYVSNFKLTNVDGTVYTVLQDSCYFLIDESDPDTHEPILNVPEGEYKAVSFIIGIDSLKSTKNISERTGCLDPTGVASDMYWNTNSGYIFLNMEGTSSTSAQPGNAIKYQVGGFGGISIPTMNNIKTITLDLTTRGTAKVKSGKETNIHLMVDVLKIFNGPTNVSIATDPFVAFDPYSIHIANNYASMIRHDHTEN